MIEQISYKEQIIALIIRRDYKSDGLEFFAPDDFSQQLAYMHHPKGKIIQAHTHNHMQRNVFFTQEVLVIKNGKLKANFYSDEREYLESRVLEAGDIILLAYDITVSRGTSPHYMYLSNQSVLADLCKFIEKNYSDPDIREENDTYYKTHFLQTGKLGGISDMTFVGRFIQQNHIKYLDLSQSLISEYTIDHNINCCDEYEFDKTYNIKRIVKRNKEPYCFNIDMDRYVKMYALHFQGLAKKIIPAYYYNESETNLRLSHALLQARSMYCAKGGQIRTTIQFDKSMIKDIKTRFDEIIAKRHFIFYGAGRNAKLFIDCFKELNIRLPDAMWDVRSGEIDVQCEVPVVAPDFDLLNDGEYGMIITNADTDIICDIIEKSIKLHFTKYMGLDVTWAIGQINGISFDENCRHIGMHPIHVCDATCLMQEYWKQAMGDGINEYTE